MSSTHRSWQTLNKVNALDLVGHFWSLLHILSLLTTLKNCTRHFSFILPPPKQSFLASQVALVVKNLWV